MPDFIRPTLRAGRICTSLAFGLGEWLALMRWRAADRWAEMRPLFTRR